MQTMKKFFILFLCFTLASCHSWHEVSLVNAPTELKAGNKVRLTDRHGKIRKTRVTAVDESQLFDAKNNPIPYHNINQLEVKKFSAGKTAGATVITGVVIAGLAVGLSYLFIHMLGAGLGQNMMSQTHGH